MVITTVTDMVRNIYEVENINQENEAQFIENEEYNLGLMAEDDDFGERGGEKNFKINLFKKFYLFE